MKNENVSNCSSFLQEFLNELQEFFIYHSAMDISVIGGHEKEVFKLGVKIVRDWANKIAKELKEQSSSIELPYFSVLLTDQSEIKYNEKQSKVDLIVILERSDLSSAEMLALSGQLSTFGQNPKQFVPAHVAEVTIANSIAITVLQYYLDFISQPQKNKKRQTKIHKLNCIDCLKYFGAFNVSAKAFGMMSNPRGNNILDGGAPFYAIYPTKEGLLALGNLEPKFYQEMVEEMGLSEEDKEFCLENQINTEQWPRMRAIFAKKLLEKSAVQWENVMRTRDTCVTAVKNFQKLQQSFLHPNLIKPKL